MTITVAEPAARWIDERVASGDYPDADTYVAKLIEHDRREAAKLVVLRAAIQEGFDSGISDKTIDQIFEEAMTPHAHG